MRKNFGPKTYLYPQPVLIIATYDEDGHADAMNAAWGGISEAHEISICLDASHKTTSNLLKTGAFTVSVGTAEKVRECDYLGVVSGNKEPDKLKKAGFHITKSEFVNAPLIDELPMTLECKVKSYNTETEILVGDIVNVSADESILTDDKIDPAKLKPITFDPVNNAYLVLGEKVGNAFLDGLKLK